MKHHRAAVLLVLFTSIFAGCKGGSSGVHVSGNSANAANVSFVITATDAPRPAVSVLSLEVTLTSAQLNPGSVALLSAPAAVDLARLRSETSLLGTASVPAGTYTSAALTFANPSITFKNDTATAVVVGTVTCAAGSVCVASVPASGLAGNVSFGGGGLILTANQSAAVALNLNLATVLSSALQANFVAASSVTQLMAAQQNGPFTTIEDVVGIVTAKDAANNRFTLHTALSDYAVAVNSGTLGTNFANFPAAACSAANFTCIAAGQIVAVNLNLQPDNTPLATRVNFEDAASTQPEIEGIVVANTGLTAPAQFSMVVLQETPAGAGPAIGSVVTVAAQPAVFDVENLGASSATASFSFHGVQDVIVGQELQIQPGSNSTSTQLSATRVRLRSSRIVANVSNVALPMLTLGPAETLPSFLAATGITQIQVFTVPFPNAGAFTEVGGTASDITQIAIGNTVAVRGQLFKNGTSNTGSPAVALVATEIIRY